MPSGRDGGSKTMAKDEPMDVEEKAEDALALPDSTYDVDDDLVS